MTSVCLSPANSSVKSWDRGKRGWGVQDLCMRMTLETTCRIGFGVELGCLSASLPDIPFARCFDDANYISFYRFTDPFWKLKQFMCVGKERELKNCMQELDNFTYKVIQTQRTEMASAELFGRTKVGLMLLIMFWQREREMVRVKGLLYVLSSSFPFQYGIVLICQCMSRGKLSCTGEETDVWVIS